MGRTNVIQAMRALFELFSPRCRDGNSLAELIDIAQVEDPSQRAQRARNQFDRIRRRTLTAEEAPLGALHAQYLFEEACAKTLYNLSHAPAPYDPDAPYWVVHNALQLGRALGIDDAQIVGCIAPLG
jgi:hypothetical protein